MSLDQKIRSLCFEGIDGSGKLTATLSFLAWYLKNYPEHKVYFASFPVYWGFGNVVRQMNRGKADLVLKNLPPIYKAKVRMASFVLDRLLVLGILENLNLVVTEDLLVTDRGPYSNAITISYIAQNEGLTAQQQQELINYIQELEQELLSTLDYKNIICKVPHTSSALSEREALDELEAADNQQETQDVLYELIPKQLTVETKTETSTGIKWRDRSSIAEEIANITELTTTKNKHIKDNEISMLLKKSLHSSQLQGIGPLDFLKLIGIADKLSTTETLNLQKWEQIFIEDPIPENFTDGKDTYLSKFEPKIFEQITKLMLRHGINLETTSPLMKKGVNRIVSDYPELKQIISTVLEEPEANSWLNLLATIQKH